MSNATTKRPPREDGIALIAALLFLLVISALTISGVKGSSLQEVLSRNHKLSTEALMVAEGGLSRAVHELAGRYDEIMDVIRGDNASIEAGDPSYRSQAQSLGAGAYSYEVIGVQDLAGGGQLLRVVSTGRVGQAVEQVEVLVRAQREGGLRIDGALSLYKNLADGHDQDVDLEDRVRVDGRDHDRDGNLLPSGGRVDLPGLYVNGESAEARDLDMESGTVLEGAGEMPVKDPDSVPSAQRDADGNVLGAKGGGGASTKEDWDDFVDHVIDNALYDTRLRGSDGDIEGFQSFGERANPEITYVSGEVEFEGSVEGVGILIIDGRRVEFERGFEWEGLVIVRSKSGSGADNLEHFGRGGRTEVRGAVVVAGERTQVRLQGGDTDILYSSEAIADVVSALEGAGRISTGGGKVVVEQRAWRQP